MNDLEKLKAMARSLRDSHTSFDEELSKGNLPPSSARVTVEMKDDYIYFIHHFCDIPISGVPIPLSILPEVIEKLSKIMTDE